MSDSIIPSPIDIPQSRLDELRQRLAQTRWPDAETVGDESQGPPLAAMRSLVDRWAGGYDWRRCETVLNGLGPARTTVDGLDVFFLHVRSPEPGALPLLMTHGWPGSVLEFRHVVGPLTDPVAHGGRASFPAPLDVRDLAETVGMSVSAFYTHFKTVTGAAPLQFYKRLRLLEAQRLLASEGAGVSEAAFAVGYQGASQFSREYKRAFGVPPGQHAARLRSGAVGRLARPPVGD